MPEGLANDPLSPDDDALEVPLREDDTEPDIIDEIERESALDYLVEGEHLPVEEDELI